jgi:hypothetical protein
MADEKPNGGVPRVEFYGTVAIIFLMIALVSGISGRMPESDAGQVGAWFLYVALYGLSIKYAVKAIRERGQRMKGNDEDAPAK